MRNLNVESVHSFWSELEKIAVSVDDLFRSVSAAKKVHVGDSMQALRGGGAYAYPPKPVVREVINRRFAPAKNFFSTANELASKLPSGKVRDFGTAVTGRWQKNFDRGLKLTTSDAEQAAGNIYADPKLIGPALGLPAGSSPDAVRGLTASSIAHELYERGVKKKDVALLYSHLAPEVLLKEHNLLSRLEGAGADQARAAMRSFRQTSGEAPHMKALLTHVYGPRASQFTEEGAKIPMAMVRDLRKKLAADPTLLDKAKAAVPRGSLLERAKGNLEWLRAQNRMRRALQSASQQMGVVPAADSA